MNKRQRKKQVIKVCEILNIPHNTYVVNTEEFQGAALILGRIIKKEPWRINELRL